MFVDLIKFFSDIPDFKKAVLDNYQLGNGLYIIVENGQIKELISIDKDTDCSGDDYKWLKEADYYSQLIDMNKPVDPNKKIHSCNPFSIFIKADILPDYGSGDKVLTMDELGQAIKRYYKVLTTVEKKDKYVTEILNTANLPEVDLDLFESCKNWLLNNLEEIVNTVKDNPPPKGSYVKVFFKQHEDKYECECRRYLLPKIFNKNDFNIKLNDEILGLSNFNMGLNAKKPYLELMSTQFKVPFRISLEDAITLKCFFEWISDYRLSDGKRTNCMYISNSNSNKFSFSKDLNSFVSGYFINFKEKKEGTFIADFEYLPLNPDEQLFFRIENYLGIDNWRYNDSYNIGRFEKIIDFVFFAGRLVPNYLVDTNDMQSNYKAGEYSKNLENLMLMYRKALHNYFRKGDRNALEYCVDKMSKSCVLEIIKIIDESRSSQDEKSKYKKTKYEKAEYAFNLRLALLKQISKEGDGGMGDYIIELSDIVRKKRDMDGVQPKCDSDKEFFFTCGQLTRYLLSLSEAAEPKHSFVESYIKAKDSSVLKRKIKELYVTYGHAISLKSIRFDNLMSMVVGYETDAVLKDYDDYFLAGFLSKNLIYEKKQEDDKNENAE